MVFDVIRLIIVLVDAVHSPCRTSALYITHWLPSASFLHIYLFPVTRVIGIVFIAIILVDVVVIEMQSWSYRKRPTMRVRVRRGPGLIEYTGLRVDLMVFTDLDPTCTYTYAYGQRTGVLHTDSCLQ